MSNDVIQQKESEYTTYVENHIKNVQSSWEKLQTLFPSESFVTCKDVRERISARVLQHDRSKFSEAEFEKYRKFFYPVSKDEKNYEDFQIAWKHHLTANDHHWEHWVAENGEILERGENVRVESLIEMICDWMAMAVVFGGSAPEYYQKNKTKIQLRQEDRAFVERILGGIY